MIALISTHKSLSNPDNPFHTPGNSTEEQNLLDKLAEGDRSAFWDLWILYQHYLYARCLAWMGNNPFEAEEALSLAALRAWDHLPKHASKITNLKGWLNRLTHNICIDLHRQNKRQALSIGNIEKKCYDLPTISSASTSPETALIQTEFRVYLNHGIKTLPSRLKHPLILRYYQDMSCMQIGETLSLKQNTVSKRLQEAKSILRELLSQYFSGLSILRFDDVQFQRLEKENFQTPIQIDSSLEEISYRVTISCLETLPPAWFSSPQGLAWT
ncbi:MAG: RNA polymerase sigma factor [Cyanobacteria bacterium P01_F01_bin.53]